MIFEPAPIQHLPLWFILLSIVLSLFISFLFWKIFVRFCRWIAGLAKSDIDTFVVPIIILILFHVFLIIGSIVSKETTVQEYVPIEADKISEEIKNLETQLSEMKQSLDISYNEIILEPTRLLIEIKERNRNIERNREMITISAQDKKWIDLTKSIEKEFIESSLPQAVVQNVVVSGGFFLIGIVVSLERRYRKRKKVASNV